MTENGTSNLDEKHLWYISITLKALSLRKKPMEMLDFMDKYKEYFPGTTTEGLDKIRGDIITSGKIGEKKVQINPTK